MCTKLVLTQTTNEYKSESAEAYCDLLKNFKLCCHMRDESRFVSPLKKAINCILKENC